MRARAAVPWSVTGGFPAARRGPATGRSPVFETAHPPPTGEGWGGRAIAGRECSSPPQARRMRPAPGCRRRQRSLEAAAAELDADVVGASVEVLARSLGDGGRVAPGDDRIDEAIAALAGQVVVARSPAGAGCRRSSAVRGSDGEGAGDAPRLGRVGLQDGRHLDRQAGLRAEDRARHGGVLDGHEVGMGAVRPLGRQLEHAWARGRPAGGWAATAGSGPP